MFLAGDVGGTKTHLALYRPGDSPRSPVIERKLPSADHASLETLVREFLTSTREQPTRVALGIAGPVVGNRAATTNLPWAVDGATLGRELGGAEVVLLNDLTATARGLGLLAPGELEVLQPGVPARSWIQMSDRLSSTRPPISVQCPSCTTRDQSKLRSSRSIP